MVLTSGALAISPPARRFHAWQAVAGLAIVLALTTYVLLRLDIGQLGAAWDAMLGSPGIVLGMAAGYTLAFWLRAVAWRTLLTTPQRAGGLFSILQASLLLNHLLPFKAGEIARPYLATRHGVPAAEGTTTTVVARLADFAALSLIALVALPVGVLSFGLALPVAVVATAIFVATFLLASLRHSVPAFVPAAFARKLGAVQAALREIDASKVARALPVVAVSWLLEACVLYGTASILGSNISIATAIGATAFTILFQVIHLTPGGIGIYETSMTSVLTLGGLGADEALTLAIVTHGFKFAYSFTFAAPFAVNEAVSVLRGESDRPKSASRLEIVVARTWNVFNEGKPFTPVFSLIVLGLLALPHITESAYWPRFGAALLLMMPLALMLFRFDFPLKLRGALWILLAAFFATFQFVDPIAVALVLALYLIFTVFMWGTVYYHLRIGTPWTNFLRFWKLVIENPDPTSGNFQEQVPKLLILVLGATYLTENMSAGPVLGMQAFALVMGIAALLVHQWFFRWVPALPQSPAPMRVPYGRTSKRFIVIAIDGCRADRLREASTPCIDRLRAEGTEFTNVATVYPARTVTCFSSMLTGASPAVHGMRSNFVPSLGVKCDSMFAAMRREGLDGKLVGIAHLIDAFSDDVRTVTAVMDNEDIDDGLIARAKQVMMDEDPDLLVLQLLSVDQTGHARGSYYPEYLHKITVTDQKIDAFLTWCDESGYLEGATVVITADHGQGIGIGGHGHMSPPEIHIPCILWGAGVEPGVAIDEPRFIIDIAPTITHYLGIEPPADNVGSPLLSDSSADEERPIVYVIPAHNEADNLPAVLTRIAATAPSPHRVVVVDDGSTDETADLARVHGAVVVAHETNRGLGAALRTGLRGARVLNARAAVYLDADGEYDPVEAQRLLDPIERDEADYVLGSRFKGTHEGMAVARRVANAGFSALLSLVCGRWISDGQTGYRAFSARAIAVAEIVHDYNYAQVLTMDLLRKGMRMTEMPVSYQRRQRGRSFVSLQYLWRVPLGMAREMLAG